MHRRLGSMESHFGDLSVTFFETGLLFVFCSLLFGNTEKVSQKDSQKGLPGGPQEGSRLDGSAIFTFAAGLQNGSQNGTFGEPRSSLYSFLFADVTKIGLQKALTVLI